MRQASNDRRTLFDRPRAVLQVLIVLLATSLAVSPLTAQDADRARARKAFARIDQLEKANRHAEAIPLAEDSLAILERSLGVEHKDTMPIRGRVAELYIAIALFARAEMLLRQNFDIYEKAFSPGLLPGGIVSDQRGQGRRFLTGRAFWLQDERAPDKGYGAYSFLLFAAPPKDQAERARFLKALEAYVLVLLPIAQLERHRSRSQLNVTLIPVSKPIGLPDELVGANTAALIAARILEVYDFARAQAVLDDLDGRGLRTGPYLVTTVAFAQPGTPTTRLFLDMSHVLPEQIWDWTRTFCWLAAQERSWSQVTLQKLLLNVRNALGIAEQDIVRLIRPTG